MIGADRFALLALALVLDALAGDPDWLWRRLPHPVAIIGRGIAAFDAALNRPERTPRARRLAGSVALAVIIGAAFLIGLLLESALDALPYGWLVLSVLAAILLAGRSLYNHVAAVASALERDGLGAARQAVAKIVGRDPEKLDEAAVARAALESAAENFSDGLVAPAVWFALLGLPGLLAYKALNTADSMIGHRSPRYRDYGWAAARLDDLANWPAARLAGLLVCLAAPLAGGSVTTTFRTMLADARQHRSPNAGWPEAALAAALGVALAGPRSYAGVMVEDAYMNRTGRREAGASDIRRGLRVYAGAWFACLLLAIGLALAV